MVQAGYNYARDLALQPVSEPAKRERHIHRTYKKVNRKQEWLIKIGICFFLYACLVVFLCIKGAVLGYQIVQLENDINKLEASADRMEYEIAQKSSLEKIEQLAVAELGMHHPEEHMKIAGSCIENQEMKTDEYPETVEAQTAGKPLGKLYASLVHLAVNNN
jgi:cell division protein FtsL